MITNDEMAVLEYVMGGDREVYGRTVSGNQKCLTNMEQTPTRPAVLEPMRLTSYHRQNGVPKEPNTSTEGTDTTNYH